MKDITFERETFGSQTAKTAQQPSIFRPGQNCWRVETATYASMLVDCANYYRALYLALCKAKHSIFVLGWDIDSRIQLLRGEDAEGCQAPTEFFELMQYKALENPDLQIYLNKWDYSIFFAQQREPFAGLRWARFKKPNIHYLIDGMLPVGACHHQKVIIVDDEVAFCGGMDIALGRWDHREHLPENECRADPGGIHRPHRVVPFDPYHDIQIVTAGPVAWALGELVRERWRLACGREPVPIRRVETNGLPPAWPESDPPDFTNARMAIVRNIPAIYNRPRVREVENIYLDQIARAEDFIYIENQFLARETIAHALNRRLREQPGLRVLAVSPDVPKGIMEKKSQWTPRVRFREIIESGGVADRTGITFPISQVDGVEKPVRIHSKLMIVDDKFLHIGSSNINSRSMGIDTECDLVLEGQDAATRCKIAAIRTDLIREHTGRAADEIDALVLSGAPISAFLKDVAGSRQHLRRVNDEPYRNERFATFVRRIGDPEIPIIPANLTMVPNRLSVRSHMKPIGVALAVAISVFMLAWNFTPVAYLLPDRAIMFLSYLNESSFAHAAAYAFFTIGGLAFLILALTLLKIMAASAAWLQSRALDRTSFAPRNCLHDHGNGKHNHGRGVSRPREQMNDPDSVFEL